MSGPGTAVGLEEVSLLDLPESGRVTLFEREPQTVRLALEAGETVPAHRHPDRDIVFHLLSGELDLVLGDETISLTPGDVVRFAGDQDISPRAETDCEALVVLAPSG